VVCDQPLTILRHRESTTRCKNYFRKNTEKKMESVNSVNSQLEATKQNLSLFIKPEMSLPMILDLMTQVDEGVVSASNEELETLMGRATTKIDSYKFIEDEYEDVEERLAVRIKEFQAAKKTVSNKKNNLKKLLVYSMQKNGFTKFKGEDYKVHLLKTKSIDPKREPRPMDVVIAPELVKVTYEWKKTEIKKAMEKGDEFATAIASVKEKTTPVFTVNKGIADD